MPTVTQKSLYDNMQEDQRTAQIMASNGASPLAVYDQSVSSAKIQMITLIILGVIFLPLLIGIIPLLIGILGLTSISRGRKKVEAEIIQAVTNQPTEEDRIRVEVREELLREKIREEELAKLK